MLQDNKQSVQSAQSELTHQTFIRFTVSFYGGQYNDYWHTEVIVRAKTKTGLIREVKKWQKEYAEYWDNWQGWHEPHAIIMLSKETKTRFSNIDDNAVFPTADIPAEGDESCSRYALAKHFIIDQHEDNISFSTKAKNEIEKWGVK